MEVKKTTEILPEKHWLAVDDITDDLFKQHYSPTECNKDIKLLTTEQYIPPWLKFDINHTVKGKEKPI